MAEANEKNSYKLITPGLLGSCWHGKYHYLEPWVGCEHACLYCYGRSRKDVQEALALCGTIFKEPKMPYVIDDLLKRIEEEIKINNAKVLKLCRYTDIFTPYFVATGMAYQILKTLCETSVERIIITTKGVPDKDTISLIKKNKNKFSYNTVIKPECENILDNNLVANEKRLEILSEFKASGVANTAHLDPLAFSIAMSESEWEAFLVNIQSFGIKRIMFSYLMLDDILISHIKSKLDLSKFNELIGLFETTQRFSQTYADEKLIYIKKELRFKHVDIMKNLLDKLKFDYVLCSLKSLKGDGAKLDGKCNLCDGAFYA